MENTNNTIDEPKKLTARQKKMNGVGIGNNPNSHTEKSLKNLKVFKEGEERTREMGRKGAKKYAENCAIRRSFQEIGQEMLTDDDRRKMLDMLYKRAKEGNIKALELAVDIIGEKQSHKIDRERLALERQRLAMDEKKSEKDTAVVVRFEGMEELTD